MMSLTSPVANEESKQQWWNITKDNTNGEEKNYSSPDNRTWCCSHWHHPHCCSVCGVPPAPAATPAATVVMVGMLLPLVTHCPYRCPHGGGPAALVGTVIP